MKKIGLALGAGGARGLAHIVILEAFEELKIPLKIVVTDYWSKEQVVISSGKLLPAVRASFSLPGLFTPVKNNNTILIDGGMVNPLPYDILKMYASMILRRQNRSTTKPNPPKTS